MIFENAQCTGAMKVILYVLIARSSESVNNLVHVKMWKYNEKNQTQQVHHMYTSQALYRLGICCNQLW